jgi:hypothetical protein
MPKWLLAPRIFGLPWRGLVHRGGWTATDFLAGKWPRWRTSWPTAWRQIALRRLVLAHALRALRARANAAFQARVRTNPPMVWRLIMLAFVALRRIPSALSAWWAASRAIGFAHSPRFAELRDGWAMSAPLLALNVFMAGLSVFFFITIVHTPSTPDSRTPSRTGRAFAVTVTASHKHEAAAPGSPLGGAYDVIATRNLFHPNRSDAMNLGSIVETLPPAAALALYGVVISEDTRLAYLEDPATKRIVGYKIGDKLAGGQVQGIGPDRVVIMRAGGLIEVRLHDPNRPRPVISESPQAQGTNERPRRRPGHDS